MAEPDAIAAAATALADALPQHDGGLSLHHNPHRAYRQTVAEYFDEAGGWDAFGWAGEEEKQRIVETGELWTLQWGFEFVAASSLEALLRAAASIEGRSQ